MFVGVVVEIIIFIIIAVIFYIFILPFINTFGSNSEHKNSGKLKKTKEAFKQVGQNSKATLKVTESGLNTLNRGLDGLNKYLDQVNADLEKYNNKQKTINKEQDLKEFNSDYSLNLLERKKENTSTAITTKKHSNFEDIDAVSKDLNVRKKLEAIKRGEEELHGKAPEQSITNTAELEKKKRVDDVERILAEHKESLAKEERLRKERLQVQKLEVEQLKNNQTIEVKLERLETALVEFIYIRYYLTGLKTLPSLKCIYESWAKTPYAETELNEEVWGKIIEQMSFDETKCKKIDALYHFTHKDNLPSILSKGLMTKKTLEELKISFKHNDENRWDAVQDSISLSISRPHHKMFMKYAKPTGMHNWVILKISPTLITSVENSCLDVLRNYDYIGKSVFNKFNAASFAMKKLTIEERKTHKAFLDMFESPIGKTLETFTYDNQAEILYLGNIPSEFIEEIQVVKENTELSWVRNLGFKLSINTTVLEKR